MTASSRLEPSLPPSRANPHQDTSDAFETCANVIKAIQGHILARAAYVRAIQTAAAVERPNAARAACACFWHCSDNALNRASGFGRLRTRHLSSGRITRQAELRLLAGRLPANAHYR